MHEGAMMFNYGVIIAAISIVIAICILVICKRKNFEFANDKTLPRAAKSLSLIPFAFHLITIALMFGSVFASKILDDAIVLMTFAVSLNLSGISATIGPAAGLLGIVFSVVYARKNAKRGVGCIITSGISMLISLGILVVYIYILLPYALAYYGLR